MHIFKKKKIFFPLLIIIVLVVTFLAILYKFYDFGSPEQACAWQAKSLAGANWDKFFEPTEEEKRIYPQELAKQEAKIPGFLREKIQCEKKFKRFIFF